MADANAVKASVRHNAAPNVTELRPVKRDAAPAQKQPAKQTGEPNTTGLSALVFYFLVAAAIYAGWLLSPDERILPEEGLGYDLGIAGGAMMLLLVLYPLRKKARFMRNWGATRHWFRAHMIIGILGPVLVLFHSNFQLGSLNSNVVLFSTLIVAASGLVGRYFYTKVHDGLYGSELDLKNLKQGLEAKMNDGAAVLNYTPKLKEKVLELDADVLKPRFGFFEKIIFHTTMGFRIKLMHVRLLLGLSRAVRIAAWRANWSAGEKERQKKAVRAYIREHMDACLRIAEFSLYERLLSLWHVFHFPLFLMLILSGIIHVVAVHMY